MRCKLSNLVRQAALFKTAQSPVKPRPGPLCGTVWQAVMMSPLYPVQKS